jgi:hypothetical protein
MSTSLHVIAGCASAAPVFQPGIAPGSVSERIRQLRIEARGLARDQVDLLRNNLLEMQQFAAEIAGGGEAYPPGVREIAARISDDSAAKAATLAAIMSRS